MLSSFFNAESSDSVVVAELGTSHGGSLSRAHELIDRAKDAGANCVKFQLVFADEIVHSGVGEIDLPGGKTSIYKRFKEVERGIDFYRHLKSYCEEREIFFLCSVFGIKSARILNSLDVKVIKIASPELNHYPLLREVALYGKLLVLSSGVSTLGDIEKALSITGSNVVLLHCVTSYPASEEQYNLRMLPHLAAIFGVPTGVSDHSLDPLLIPTLSAALGAALIEKHFTLSRTGNGLDDTIALEPVDFADMVRSVRRAETSGLKETKRFLSRKYGQALVEKTVGDGAKRLTKSELNNYSTTNRSVLAKTEIRAGEILLEEKIAVLRSEKNTPPGVGPEYLEIVLGKKVTKDIPAGSGITWDALLMT